MVLYEIYREDGGNGITFVHMLYIRTLTNMCGAQTTHLKDRI